MQFASHGRLRVSGLGQTDARGIDHGTLNAAGDIRGEFTLVGTLATVSQGVEEPPIASGDELVAPARSHGEALLHPVREVPNSVLILPDQPVQLGVDAFHPHPRCFRAEAFRFHCD